jgi:hypothetical protein
MKGMRRRDLIAVLALAALPLVPGGAMAGEEKKKKKSGGTNYIPINAITGTTYKSGGRRGVLSVDCGLQVDDPKLREYAQLSLPRLQAAYAQVIQIYAAGLPSGAEPNTEFIVQALQRQTDLILKRPGARFLIGAVLVN